MLPYLKVKKKTPKYESLDMAASHYSNATNFMRSSHMSNANFHNSEMRDHESSLYNSIKHAKSKHAFAPYKRDLRSRSDLKNRMMLNPILT